MPWTDAFIPCEQRNHEIVMQNTWGHLAPKRNVVYHGRLVWAVGCFSEGELNPVMTFCKFVDRNGNELDSSPWLYYQLQDFISKDEFRQTGAIWEFDGYIRNYKLHGKTRVLLDTNQDVPRGTQGAKA